MPLVAGTKTGIPVGLDTITKILDKLFPPVEGLNSLSSELSRLAIQTETKKAKEATKNSIKECISSTLGIKMKESIVDKILDSIQDSAAKLEIVLMSPDDLDNFCKLLPKDMSPKIRYAAAGCDVFALNLLKDNEHIPCLIAVKFSEDMMWVPVCADTDNDGQITDGELFRINNVMLSSIENDYKHAYTPVITGPRGGVLELGTLYLREEKREEEVKYVLANECKITIK